MLTFPDFRRRSSAYHALLFRRVEELLSTTAAGSIASSWLRSARERDFAGTLAAATPFFWLAALRVVGEGLDGAVSSERAYELVIQSWDSFADVTGVETLDLDRDFPRDVCLPKHGFGLHRKDDTRVRIDRTRLDVELGERVAFPIVGVPAKLLVPQFPSLFEAPYSAELCADRAVAAELRESVSRALALLAGLDDEHASIAGAVKFFVPVSTTSLRTHRSFTSPQLKGVIFLSLALDDLRLAEAIVHESKHTELNVVLDATSLFDGDDEVAYYSPWRDDARPIAGLYHGIYVFAAVARFYATLLARDRRPEDREFILRRIEKTVAQALAGIAQIDRAALTDEGRAILDAASADLEILTRTYPLRPTIANELDEHKRAWIVRHPNLATEADRYAAHR